MCHLPLEPEWAEEPSWPVGQRKDLVMLVRELMSRTVYTIAPDATLAEAARKMREYNIGCLPIFAATGIVGIVTEKDFTVRAVAEGMDPLTTAVCRIMTPGVSYSHTTDNVADVLQIMDKKKIHHLPVLGETGLVEGIIALSDLALKGPPDAFDDVLRVAFSGAMRKKAKTFVDGAAWTVLNAMAELTSDER